MRMTSLLTLALISTIGCGSQKDDGKLVDKVVKVDGKLLDEELAKLQGTWQQVSARANGEDLPSGVISESRIIIKGNKKTVQLSGQVIFSDVLIEIDPGANPKVWDERPGKGSGGNLVIRGIYKLSDDTLTRCVAAADEDRPTEFVSKAGSGHTLQVFKRVNGGGGD
jgi:uncharacterized protein (TIGR03067 family)